MQGQADLDEAGTGSWYGLDRDGKLVRMRQGWEVGMEENGMRGTGMGKDTACRETGYYLKILKEDIHSAVFATVDSQGLPSARVIDIMLADEESLYFITARGKAFYRQLMERKFVAVSGMTGGRSSMERKAVSVRGRVENIGKARLEEVFRENPYMAEIYPGEESRMALEVFRLGGGQGEYFDLSTKPVTRAGFVLGKQGQEHVPGEYYITRQCRGCGLCIPKCPQDCIDRAGLPYAIRQENCLHCGNCLEVCPFGAVGRRT